ncbi:hypothetical protein EPUS_07072 [Endocarpon pusillum Z07020]|uniref:Uncharacterized protein n=1 Tax=Endocarpon pusillum (strain Z07020 / HMAS-L-300199) TaxID=1263415 RepID=U1HZL8_ENDPU|nr:uncharacterized protein EPUS_07072 [Endocarpon pusillum Z07020]ERF76365.1 hypothetical protein EPUS_07072 [Endocarpon pusillum Z07020]
MTGNTPPPSGVNNNDLDKSVANNIDPELDGLLHVPQQKRTRRTANHPAGVEQMTTSPNKMEEAARRPSAMINKDPNRADDPVHYLGPGITSKVSPLKRKHQAVDPAGRGESSTSMPNNRPEAAVNNFVELLRSLNSAIELNSQQGRSTHLISPNIRPLQQATPQPQQPRIQAQPASSPQPKGRYPENKLFPSSEQALPPNLTLQEICRGYPNHLSHGPILRRFLNVGWTGRMIWDHLQESARVSRSATRGWNKYEQRLKREKRQMDEEEEQEGFDPTEQGGQDSSIPQVSRDGAGSALVHTSPSNIQRETRARLATFTPAVFSHGGSGEDQASLSVQSRLATVQSQIRAEVKSHGSIFLTLMSYEDPQWPSLSRQERVRRAEAEWLRRAMRLERAFVLDNDIDDGDLEIPRTSTLDMMRRLYLLVKRASQPMSTAAATTEPEQTALFDESSRLATYQQQLEILQGWTVQWQEEIQARAQGATGAADAQMSRSRLPPTNRYLDDQPGRSNSGSTIAARHAPSLYPVTSELSQQGRSQLGFPGFGTPLGYTNSGYGTSPNPQGYYQQPWESGNGQSHADPYLARPPPGLLGAANLEANAGSADRSGLQEHQGTSAYPPIEELVPSVPESTSEFSHEHSVGPTAMWNMDDLLKMDEDLHET